MAKSTTLKIVECGCGCLLRLGADGKPDAMKPCVEHLRLRMLTPEPREYQPKEYYEGWKPEQVVQYPA